MLLTQTSGKMIRNTPTIMTLKLISNYLLKEEVLNSSINLFISIMDQILLLLVRKMFTESFSLQLSKFFKLNLMLLEEQLMIMKLNLMEIIEKCKKKNLEAFSFIKIPKLIVLVTSISHLILEKEILEPLLKKNMDMLLLILKKSPHTHILLKILKLLTWEKLKLKLLNMTTFLKILWMIF